MNQFQESLLLSIIPKHIASQVGEEVSNFLSNLTNEGVTERFRCNHLINKNWIYNTIISFHFQ